MKKKRKIGQLKSGNNSWRFALVLISACQLVSFSAFSDDTIVPPTGGGGAGIDAQKIRGRNVSASLPANGQAFLWSSSLQEWAPSAISSGGGTWGTIMGTLSDQSDLQTALDAKFDSANIPVTANALEGDNSGGIVDSGISLNAGGGQIEIINDSSGTTLTVTATGTLGTAAYTASSAYQPADADLTTWASITPGTGVGTALGVNVGSAGAPVLFNGAGGTPSSLTLTNATGLPESGVTSLTSDLALKAPLASPTFTGTVTLPSGQALIAPALGTPASGVMTNVTGTASGLTAGNVGNIAATTTFASDLTGTPLNTGGWLIYRVSGSDVTETGQSLVDITGLVSGTLSNSATYEIQAVLKVSTSADSTGCKYGIHGGGTGSAATCQVVITGSSSSTAATTTTLVSIDTGGGTFLNNTSAKGVVVIQGFVTTMSTGTATISLQHLKVTSGTSTVSIGSVMRLRKI